MEVVGRLLLASDCHQGQELMPTGTEQTYWGKTPNICSRYYLDSRGNMEILQVKTKDSHRCDPKSLKVMAKGRAYLEWVGGAEKGKGSFEHGFILVKHFGFVTFNCLENLLSFFFQKLS